MNCKACDHEAERHGPEAGGCVECRCRCPVVEMCDECGYPTGSYAHRIRHVQMNTGWAKSAND